MLLSVRYRPEKNPDAINHFNNAYIKSQRISNVFTVPLKYYTICLLYIIIVVICVSIKLFCSLKVIIKRVLFCMHYDEVNDSKLDCAESRGSLNE